MASKEVLVLGGHCHNDWSKHRDTEQCTCSRNEHAIAVQCNSNVCVCVSK